MFLAEVIGQVVATKKDESMTGRKLLVLRPRLVDEAKPGGKTFDEISADELSAFLQEKVPLIQQLKYEYGLIADLVARAAKGELRDADVVAGAQELYPHVNLLSP